MQAPSSPNCQSPAPESEHHAHKVIISSGVESSGKAADDNHHGVRGKLEVDPLLEIFETPVSSGGQPFGSFLSGWSGVNNN